MRSGAFQLTTVVVGDEPDAWSRAGFTMHDNTTRIGQTTIVCDATVGSGIVAVAIAGLTAPVDGLPIRRVNDRRDERDAAHRNRVVGLDHLVAMSPDIDRTAAALIDAGLERRRSRAFAVGDETRRQDFFWLGDVILELVGVTSVTGDAEAATAMPASFWGLALECDDLDAAATELGDGLGRVKDAVQTGRRIATIRTRDLGISVPIALMSPHQRDATA